MYDEMISKQLPTLKKIRNLTFIIAGILIVIGIALMAAPAVMNNVLGFLLGAISFCLGIYRLVVYFRLQRIESVIATDLFLGILFAVIGFVCLIYHGQMITYGPLIFGLFLIFGCVIKIQDAMILQKIGHMNWWLPLILGFVSLIFSVLVIIKPGFIEGIFLPLSGFFLFYDGVTCFGTGAMWEVFQRQLKKGVTTGWGHPPVPGEETPSGAAADPMSVPAADGAAAGAAEQGMSAVPAPEEKKPSIFSKLFGKKEPSEADTLGGTQTAPSGDKGSAEVEDAVYETLDEQAFSSTPHDASMPGVHFESVPEESAPPVSAEAAPAADPLPELRPDPVTPEEPMPAAHFDPETGEKLTD